MIKEIEDDIVKVTSDIYNHTKDLFKQGKITISEFNEFGIIIENLCEYLNSQVGNILEEAVEEVKKVVKTFMSTDEEGMEYMLNKFEKEKKVFKLNINGKKVVYSCEFSLYSDEIKFKNK